jgi:hypothetical protein
MIFSQATLVIRVEREIQETNNEHGEVGNGMNVPKWWNE